MEDKKEKIYTLKSVQSEISRLEKSRARKKEKIKQLTAEVKEDNSKLRELENIYDKLYHESLQRKIADVWFKENKLSGEQIAKFLELSKQLHDKIDDLDIDTIVKAITSITPEQNTAKEVKVDTYSTNYSPTPNAVNNAGQEN